MTALLTRITPESLATLVGCPISEVHESLARTGGGYRIAWAIRALQVASGELPADCPDYLPPRPGPKVRLSDPWTALTVAAGGWPRLCALLGVSPTAPRAWVEFMRAPTAQRISEILRAAGLRPFFAIPMCADYRYRLQFRTPALTLEEVADGQ